MIILDFIFYCFYMSINRSNLYRDSPIFYSSLFISIIGFFPSLVVLFSVLIFNILDFDFTKNELGTILIASNILLFIGIYYRYRRMAYLEHISIKFEALKNKHIIFFVTIIGYYIIGGSLILLIPIING